MALTAPTHHIGAAPGSFAKTVIMPGDPLRAKFIAETYLENVQELNAIRCMYAYSGTYRGKPVSVMAHGIGGPSAATYAYELYTLYDVERIIRVGTAGGLSPDMKLRQMLVAMGACYNSRMAEQFRLDGTLSAIASYPLMRAALDAADRLKVPYQVGNVFSSDLFYPRYPDCQDKFADLGCLAVEMEAAALYITAAGCHKQALALLTVSDNIATGEKSTADERQTSFTAMMEVALETALTFSRD